MRTEIALGLTFAEMASDANGSRQKRDRNRVNAQKAHDALCQFVPRLILTSDEAAELQGALKRLRLAIAAIPI